MEKEEVKKNEQKKEQWLWYTMVSPCLIVQFGPILWGKTSDGAHFVSVRATEKTRTVLEPKMPQTNYRSAKC